MENDRQKKIKRFFEHRRQKPLPIAAFRVRLAKYITGAMLMIAGALGVGMLGYHGFESLSWTDSFVNASMILGGMGPVDDVMSQGGKIFAGCYALFSGLLFLVVTGLIFSPLVHRLLHQFHFDDDSIDE